MWWKWCFLISGPKPYVALKLLFLSTWVEAAKLTQAGLLNDERPHGRREARPAPLEALEI